MISIRSILSLIRWKNVIIGLLIAVLLYYVLFYHLASNFQAQRSLDAYPFLIFLIVLAFLMMAGNVINDIFDRDTDALNNKNRVLIQSNMSVSFAIKIYFYLHLVGTIMALLLALYLERWYLFLLYPFFGGILHLYSLYFKRTILWGNIMIAIMGASIPFVLVLGEWAILKEIYLHHPSLFETILGWLIFAAAFMGLSMFAREIVKDIEDIHGDASCGINTFATRYGEEKSALLFSIIWYSLMVLFSIYQLFIFHSYTLLFFLCSSIATFGFMGWIAYQTEGTNHAKKWGSISGKIKVSMLLGLVHICWSGILLSH